MSTNPFRFGALALDDAFTDRRAETRELKADILNGQDVAIFAPRRYGKTSLVWHVTKALIRQKALVAQVDLMTTPTKERLAEKLATTIHRDIASRLFRARERLAVFRGLRITPTITVDADDGSVGFSFEAGYRPADVDATLERLLQLPAELGAERERPVCLVLDEFQEIVAIDPALPKLMRAVFQEQPEVAHVYLGSRRHMMERIFNDENEPFWRSAKRVELGPIAPVEFRAYIERRFAATGRAVEPETLDAALTMTGGHPYATQELCYFLWQATPEGHAAGFGILEEALAAVLRSENAHFALIWDRASGVQRRVLQALAAEPGRPLATEYRTRHRLGAASTVQRALEALSHQELVSRGTAGYDIAEPFLAEWIVREGL
jgi:hypothetical protein